MVTLKLSKSKKAVLCYCADDSAHITSVTYLRMLLDGKCRGDLLVLKELKSASSFGLGDLAFRSKSNGKSGVNFEGL